MDPEEMGGDDWTPSMQQDYEKAKAAKGELVDAYKRGDINAEDHATLNARVGEDLGQLSAMKQAAMQKAVQSRRQQMAEDNAFQTSMQERDRAHVASNAHNHVALIANPADPTQHGLFSIDHKGDLQRLDFGDKKSDMSQSGDEPPVDESAAGSTYGDADSRAPIPYSPLSGPLAELALGATPTATPGVAPTDHTMNINIGDQQAQAKFRQGPGGWQQTSQQRLNPQTGQWEDMPVGSAMGVTPQANAPVNTPHGAISQGQLLGFVANAQAAARAAGLKPGTPSYDRYVATISDHLIKNHQSQLEREFIRSERERSVADEHRRQEKVKTETAAQKKQDAEVEAKRKEEEHFRSSYTSAYDKANADVKGEHKEWTKIEGKEEKAAEGKEPAGAGGSLIGSVGGKPGYLESPDSMREEAIKRAQQRMRDLHGWTDKHFERIGVQAGAKKEQATEEPNPATDTPKKTAPPEPTDQKLHEEFKGIGQRIGGKPDVASYEDLNRLHELLARPQEIGVDPELAARKRDGIAALLAGRANRPKPKPEPYQRPRVSKFE